ncbi:S-adenosyl-L-methionine-dependent methyltransferase [Coniochaeta sp. PMI_546]|nr:S-adenosyl-L-methionine-dependent methyltransferase [Coniochaeta sp. PMI_546]
MDQDTALSQTLTRLCKDLVEATEVLGSTTNGTGKSTDPRSYIRRTARQIISLTEAPDELWSHLTVNLAEIHAVRLLLKWGAFDQIPLEGSISFSELASKLDAEVILTARLARMLIATGLLAPAGKDGVSHTPRSRILVTDKEFAAICQLTLYDEFPQPAGVPEYFQKYGRKEPVTKTHTPYAFAHGAADKNVWEVMNQDPEIMVTFMTSMRKTNEYLSIYGVYDFSWIVPESQKSADRKLLVDVGGGAGHTLRLILDTVREIPRDRCVLQDRAEVIKAAEKREDPGLQGVQMMAVDFHQGQPVIGALVYILRRCLHDYSDGECVEMLKHVVAAMAADSKLLIMELVLTPDSPPLCYAVDLTMMAISGKERTLEDWEHLVATAGLRIDKTSFGTGTSLSVLECVRI